MCGDVEGRGGGDTDYTPRDVVSICFAVVLVAPSVGEVVPWLALIVVLCSVLGCVLVSVVTECDVVC